MPGNFCEINLRQGTSSLILAITLKFSVNLLLYIWYHLGIETEVGNRTKVGMTTSILLNIKVKAEVMESKTMELVWLRVIYSALSCTMTLAIAENISGLLKIKPENVCSWV